MNPFLMATYITAEVSTLLYSEGERKGSFIKLHLQALGNDWVSLTAQSIGLK